ncbi:MAG: DNA-binding response regulator, partial [Alphaproteobacteria bacterium RIFOXYD12_FULL_60_8]
MTEDAPHILVVDDDTRLRKLLRDFLSKEGYAVTTAADAKEARERMRTFRFDLIVLDIMMPGESGLDLTRSLRNGDSVPILLLTAMGESEDRIRGLEQGADDYLAKPFEPRELLLRINSILRRAPKVNPVEPSVLSLGAFVYHPERNELLHNGQPVRLSHAEGQILRVFAERPGDIVSRDELARRTGAEANPRTVDVQITRLRKKIEADPR